MDLSSKSGGVMKSAEQQQVALVSTALESMTEEENLAPGCLLPWGLSSSQAWPEGVSVAIRRKPKAAPGLAGSMIPKWMLGQLVTDLGLLCAVVPLLVFNGRKDVMGVPAGSKQTTAVLSLVPGLMMHMNIYLLNQTFAGG